MLREPNATKGIVGRVKDEIISRGTGNGLRSAAVMLRRMDSDGSGNLDEAELAAGLEMLGIEGLEVRTTCVARATRCPTH